MPRLLSLIPFFLLILCSCSHQKAIPANQTLPQKDSFLSTSDHHQFSIQHWNLQEEPKTILIALHGLEGAARDFRNLGESLIQQAPLTSLYALNQRGGGYDSVVQRQGDIANPELWFQDLRDLDRALRNKHPNAKVIWIGESLGA